MRNEGLREHAQGHATAARKKALPVTRPVIDRLIRPFLVSKRFFLTSGVPSVFSSLLPLNANRVSLILAFFYLFFAVLLLTAGTRNSEEERMERACRGKHVYNVPSVEGLNQFNF